MSVLLRIGLFGVGLDAYWPQFTGLKERLKGYVDRVAEKLGRPGVEVINVGLVGSTARAVDAAQNFRRRDGGITVVYVTPKPFRSWDSQWSCEVACQSSFSIPRLTPPSIMWHSMHFRAGRK